MFQWKLYRTWNQCRSRHPHMALTFLMTSGSRRLRVEQDILVFSLVRVIMIYNVLQKYSFGWQHAVFHMDRVKRIWYLSPMRAAKVQASLRIRAVSPEPPLLAHTSCESRGTFRQKTRSLAPLNGWACAVKICHDGMLEDTKSLDAAPILAWKGFIIIDYDVIIVYNELNRS